MEGSKHYVFVERRQAMAIANACQLGIVAEQVELKGYQSYIVEQWLCNRNKRPKTVKVYTGDPTHIIKVCVLSIPIMALQDPRPEIRQLVDTNRLSKYKQTPLGDIMVTDPSELPGDVDIVLVPDGDFDCWLDRAYVNINLRRCNCTGRSALNLRPPSPASIEKFYSFYKISDAVNFEVAVLNLVKVAQIALYLFHLLDKECIDGLICDQTNIAIFKFYTDYSPHKMPEYQLKDPWMEPHLLTALITKLVVCRNKLEAYNYTKIKDPFTDYEKFQLDIEKYQDSQHLPRTSKIDLETLRKLNEISVDKIRVRKVIKSKLDDISGINSNNLPLFTESFDPDVFRHHASIKALRSIWRPKIKTSTERDVDQKELLQVFRSVSEKTTKTSAAAEAILSKVASPFQRMSSHHQSERSKRGLSPLSPTLSVPTHSLTSPVSTHHEEDQILSRFSSTVPSPNVGPFRSGDDEAVDRLLPGDIGAKPWGLSSENLDQAVDRPSEDMDLERVANQGLHLDFVPCPHPRSKARRCRSVSDSDLNEKSHKFPLAVLERPRSAVDLSHPAWWCPPPPIPPLEVPMDVRAYLVYAHLGRQIQRMRETYAAVEHDVHALETTSHYLHAVLEHRQAVLAEAERQVRQVMNRQNATDDRIQSVEGKGGQLQYMLNSVNDLLQEIEDKVNNFYGKVGVLEKRMDANRRTTFADVKQTVRDGIQRARQWIGLASTTSPPEATAAYTT